MSLNRNDRTRLRLCLGLSTGLHLLLAPAFVASTVLLVDFGRASDAVRFSGPEHATIAVVIQRRQISVRRVATVAPAVVVHVHRGHFVVHVPIVHQAAAPSRRGRTAPVVASAFETRRLTRRSRQAAMIADVPTPTPTPKGTQSAARGAPNGGPGGSDAAPDTPAPQPQASAEVAQAAPASARNFELPMGGWGQNDKPLIADDTALEDLRSRFHSSEPIGVVVDEAGRAVKVILPASLPDDARAEIERVLLALRYLPADCNGMHCGGTLQISL